MGRVDGRRWKDRWEKWKRIDGRRGWWKRLSERNWKINKVRNLFRNYYLKQPAKKINFSFFPDFKRQNKITLKGFL